MALNRNEVIKDGETILSTRGTTVAPENLASGETAIDHEGNPIVGVMPTLDVDDLYRVPDDAGTPDDTDYIPYNDVSDEEEPTKKTLFSTIKTKLAEIFATKTKLNNEAKVRAIVSSHNLARPLVGYVLTGSDNEGLGLIYDDNSISYLAEIRENESYTVKKQNYGNRFRIVGFFDYPIAYQLQTTARTIYTNVSANTYTFVNTQNYKYIVFTTCYAVSGVTEEQTKGEILLTNDEVTEYMSYAKSNQEISKSLITETGGTCLTDSDNLNNCKVAGVYSVDATSASNMPVAQQGKLIVLETYKTTSGDVSPYRTQIYITSTGQMYIRRYDKGATNQWEAWRKITTLEDISPANVGNGYAVATVSGSAITATITGFQLRAGVIVSLRLGALPVDATLNINNTGAKTVKWNNENIKSFDTVRVINSSNVFTFIYDGTNYHIIAYGESPSMSIESYVANTSGRLHLITGYNADMFQLTHDISMGRLLYNYYKNSAWRGLHVLAEQDDLGASIGRAGKNVLPAWGVSYNQTSSINGLIFSFNYETGEITGNGTATADSWFVMYSGKNRTAQEYLLKGTYILSGCPSGGSESTYFLYGQVDGLSVKDYGSSATMNLSSDTKMNGDFSIFVKSGQTLNNLVFKPMLRPAWTTSDFEPCEDIHKGNCYVGTCDTAGATKDKVAYVDGYFVLRKGVRVAIKFTNTNTYSSSTTNPVTLNVNNTGAKNIWYNATHSGAGNTGACNWIYGIANRYFYYVYDGTYWTWETCGEALNSTNFLRNDANSTLTVSGAPEIVLKSTTVDTKQANNGLSNTWYPCLRFTDKNNEVFNRWESVVEPNGRIATYLYARNYNTSTSSYFAGGIKICTSKSGSLWYTITNAHYFNACTGFGYATCSTAEATTAKVASMGYYLLIPNGYVTVKFTYAVPANSTLNINSQGAKNIYYHGSAITANIINAGDLATFIYDGTQYDLIGIDRFSIDYTKDNVTIYSSINSCATGKYIEGNLNGNLLYFRIEITFKPTSSITINSSNDFLTFNGLAIRNNGFTWTDLQAYIDYTSMQPVVIGMYNGANSPFILRFRTSRTFNANTQYTFRLNFTTTARRI